MLHRHSDKYELALPATASDYFASRDYSDSSLLIVPGTSDRNGGTLSSWTDFIIERFPEERQTIVDYPATVGPLVGGLHAPRYDESKQIAQEQTKLALEQSLGRVVLLGYSQGADALWRGVEDAVGQGVKDPDELEVILWAHPQYPDGLKDTLQRKHKLTSALFRYAFHATMDGAWTPHPEVATTLIAIEGDPITHFPSVWPNPFRFASKFHAGFFMIHSGLGDESAAQLADRPVASYTTDSNMPKTSYLTLAADDPVAQRARRRM